MMFSNVRFGWFAIGLLVMVSLVGGVSGAETQSRYLTGKGNDDPVLWDFFCTKGRKSGTWTKIGVPSQWEQQGFGNYDYGNDHHYRPKGVEHHDEEGIYRRNFQIPQAWKGKRVRIVFEGVMTDAQVRVNGQLAGPIHQGGFYRFAYEITSLLKAGENQLEVHVCKVSKNKTVEMAERQADYWVLGGIFRPVFLEALPQEYIDWASVDAKADGSFDLDVFIVGAKGADRLRAQIVDSQGDALGEPFSSPVGAGVKKVSVSTKVRGHQTWTAETPHLYTVRLDLMSGDRCLHRIERKFGFRTVELKAKQGVFVNGRKIRLKGVNRHCFWPETGRTVSRALSYQDARLIKEMNMNAVRMSHYPPDKHFLEACDELGLYVINELCGWSQPAYDTEVGERLVGELVRRDQMHPSILFWANGNEGGWNTELDDDYALWDKQNRVVIHPWSLFNEIDTKHYPNYSFLEGMAKREQVFMPTEFLHGLYDGGSGSGLNDYWNLILQHEHAAGGFLWVFADEGIVRTDRNGEIDLAGNRAPDGLVGPHREKEGSFFTVKEIWSPVQVSMVSTAESGFSGKVQVENRYDFTNLDTCTLAWEKLRYTISGEEVVQRGRLDCPVVAPGERTQLLLPGDWSSTQALRVRVTNGKKQELFTWCWSLQPPNPLALCGLAGRDKQTVQVEESPGRLRARVGDFTADFDPRTGLLMGMASGAKVIPLSRGPRLAHLMELLPESQTLIRQRYDGDVLVLDVEGVNGGLNGLIWKIHPQGYLEMQCSYGGNEDDETYAFHGVTFDFPEQGVLGKRWLGQGPYRVWQNRMRGPQFGLWQCEYNDAVPGKHWPLPEFKGYFADMHWLELQRDEGNLNVVTNQSGLFARVFEPRNGTEPLHTRTANFDGGVSFLHAIPAIGTKFHAADQRGPSGLPTKIKGKQQIHLIFFPS